VCKEKRDSRKVSSEQKWSNHGCQSANMKKFSIANYFIANIIFFNLFFGLNCYWGDLLYAEEKHLEQALENILPDHWRVKDYSGWFERFIPLREHEHVNMAKPTPSPIGCRRENFDLFLHFFSEDVAFQYSNTSFPLKLILWDSTGYDEKPVTLWVNAKHYSNPSFPIFPVRAGREAVPFMYTLDLKGRDIHLKIFQEDTGYLIQYIFSWDSCWRLVQIEDSSM
jgi:hypothetical protein